MIFNVAHVVNLIHLAIISFLIASASGNAIAQEVDDDATSHVMLLKSFIIGRSSIDAMPRMNAAMADATSSSEMTFIEQSTEAVYENMRMENMNRITSESSRVLYAIIDFRDRLLEKGGSGNACLAGSITYAVHERLFYEILNGGNADVATIIDLAGRNRGALDAVCHALSFDGRFREEMFAVTKNQGNIDILRGFLVRNGEDPSKYGQGAWMRYFQRKGAGPLVAFDRALLSARDPGTILFVWALLIEDQDCFRIALDFEERYPCAIYDLIHGATSEESGDASPFQIPDADRISDFERKIDGFLTKREPMLSGRYFRAINGANLWNSISGKFFGVGIDGDLLDFRLHMQLKSYGKKKEWLERFRDEKN
jgi:hypothetical protein